MDNQVEVEQLSELVKDNLITAVTTNDGNFVLHLDNGFKLEIHSGPVKGIETCITVTNGREEVAWCEA